MRLRDVKTPVLHLAYEDDGPKDGSPLMLLHGWPDSPRTWDGVLPALHRAGFRTIAPYLRGYGPSTFRTSVFGRKRRRTGQPVAFAQDMIDLADALKLKRFAFAGHDWGAQAGYALAALFPRRLASLITLSVPFEPGPAKVPSVAQARAFWYQWLLCTKPGEAKFREDPVAFGRAQWDAWSPKAWYSAGEFTEAERSWQGRDFADVVLHSYRSRWGHAALDPEYQVLQTRFESTLHLDTPTLLIHGMDDACVLAETTDGADRYLRSYYRRALLDHVGHFPSREDPDEVAAQMLQHLLVHA